MSNVSTLIRDRIIAEFMGGTGSLSEDTPLVGEEILDSLGIFALLGFIEEKFGVEVDAEDVTMENFATVRAIADLIEKKRSTI